MPFVKILIHAVWATKDRKNLLSIDNKNKLCEHIKENAQKKDIHLININGHQNHLHCFISMSSVQSIATIMSLIKGESSYWANKNLSLMEKFEWQDEYYAVSVGQSQFNIVNDYINNQEEHHRKKSFQGECDEFFRDYNFDE
ncbi:MAG TPA: IS200/IS605 family transposase [Bacteroidales bacterium]|nr:IS200/IS605 family transposase [Bacteroidales bacterium]